MGKIHDLQDELVARIRERDLARARIIGLENDLHIERDRYKSARAEIARRPLPTKPGWKMPTATCPGCGAAIRPTVYFDIDECYLDFAEDCDGCDDLFDFESRSSDFEWPFVADTAWPSDFEALGFEVV